MTRIQVGIYGAAGYTAGELIRILNYHPEVELVALQSESQVGKKIDQIHTDLLGETNLVFSSDLKLDKLDVLFLCKGHGDSRKFLQGTELPEKLKVIDLSHDYRLKNTSDGFVYGLPELNRELISQSQKIANPGCFATCIQLGLLPASSHGLIQSEVHTTGITGSTGAGQALSPTAHFSWRNNNMSVYKAFNHQHLDEIGESLHQLSGQSDQINFIPFRGNFTRGIIATSYFDSDIELNKAYELYESFYKTHPFVHVSRENPDLKMVVNTNKAVVHLVREGNKLLVISIIDNLLKGASGQAVQNMNLVFGLDENTGLNLKASTF